MEPWQFTALSNPDVRMWWQEMQRYPEFRNANVLDFMRKQKESGIYDYQKALESGLTPSFQSEHNQYRWNDMGKMANNTNLNNKN